MIKFAINTFKVGSSNSRKDQLEQQELVLITENHTTIRGMLLEGEGQH